MPRAVSRWLLLIHQIPPKPAYLRVKVGRQLARVGAMAIKNSVYALPASESAQEAFAWVRKEIVDFGGEASVVEGGFVHGLTDEEIEALFRDARDADYRALASEAKGAESGAAPRLRRRLAEIQAVDFFGAPSLAAAERAITALESRAVPEPAPAAPRHADRKDYRGRAWVTREHVGVDRMASAWLIRKAVDPKARFRFVAKDAPAKKGEVRFDMFEGEFTHEEDLCTFEVLLRRFGIEDQGLDEIAQIVHELDLKDGKYPRADVPGMERIIASIAHAHASDVARIERASAVLDDLHRYFSEKRPTRPRRVSPTTR